MTYTLSRLMSASTLAYGGYALAEPRHLGAFLTSAEPRQAEYDLLARTYGARDLVVGSLGLFGRSERTVTTAMVARIAFDLSDGLLLAARAEDEDTRAKVLGITWGYAALNALALLADRHRARRKRPLSR
ncbi:MAG: hypothetical protein ACLGH4_03445 [Actinomycetes bacterium]